MKTLRKLFFWKEYKKLGPIKKNSGLELEVDKWRISSFILQNLIPIVGIKPYPLDELVTLTSTVCAFEPTHIYEWGTHLGKSARIFYEAVKYFKINSSSTKAKGLKISASPDRMIFELFA